MKHSVDVVPLVVRIVTAVIGLLAIALGMTGYFVPGQFVPGLQASMDATHQLVLMYSARNVAIGAVMLLVAWRGVPESIAALFIIRFLVELQDAFITLTTSANAITALPQLLIPLAFLIVEASIVVTMFRVISKRDAAREAQSREGNVQGTIIS